MKTVPTIEQVVKATAKVLCVPAELLTDPAHRARHVTKARHIAQHVARTVAFKSWPEITAAFHQTHPSAYSGAKKIEAAIAQGDKHIKKLVTAVTQAVSR